MSHFSEFLGNLNRQTSATKAVVGLAFGLSCLMAFSTGVGGATLTESIYAKISGKSTNPVIIDSAENGKAPTTLKVEIVRNGNTLCQGERATKEQETRSYSVDRPLANCPPLKVGDVVRATWTQSSEVNISFKEP